MPRTHGYSPRGKRCYGTHDWNARGRVNVIGAIVEFTFLTIGLFEGSVNSDVFHQWMIELLLPKVPTGSVIVMDNASFHKRADTLEAIRKRGCIIEFLPPYSPDLNPIEKKWAQAKAIRRSHRCDIDSIFREHLHYVSL